MRAAGRPETPFRPKPYTASNLIGEVSTGDPDLEAAALALSGAGGTCHGRLAAAAVLALPVGVAGFRFLAFGTQDSNMGSSNIESVVTLRTELDLRECAVLR